eukprot:3830355-Alexandrium_andersonii.AAC.1
MHRALPSHRRRWAEAPAEGGSLLSPAHSPNAPEHPTGVSRLPKPRVGRSMSLRQNGHAGSAPCPPTHTPGHSH